MDAGRLRESAQGHARSGSVKPGRGLGRFDARLRLPVIAAPMLRLSGPELVIAACAAGVIRSFPTANARSSQELDEWLAQIEGALAGDAGPYAANLIMRSPRFETGHSRAGGGVVRRWRNRTGAMVATVECGPLGFRCRRDRFDSDADRTNRPRVSRRPRGSCRPRSEFGLPLLAFTAHPDVTVTHRKVDQCL
jgi:hypothetical protein